MARPDRVRRKTRPGRAIGARRPSPLGPVHEDGAVARGLLAIALVPVLVAGSALPARAGAPDGIGLGPIDFRNEFVLALAHLTLAADSPDVLAPGRIRLALREEWAQSIFDEPEAATAVHVETLDTAVLAGVGVCDRVELRLELPFVNRSGGVLDSLVDDFEGLVGAQSVARRRIGLHDHFFFQGTTDEGASFGFHSGLGLEKLRIGLKLGLLQDSMHAVSLELVTALPTASPGFGTPGVDGGARLSAGQRIGPFVLYAGGSLVVLGDPWLEEIRLAKWKATVFGAVELDISDWIALVAQGWVESKCVENIHHADGLIVYIGGGVKVRLGGFFAELGLLENAEDQARSADITLHAELGFSF
jgi:hypothetical protein